LERGASSDYKAKVFNNLATGYRHWFLHLLRLKYFPFGRENFVAGKQNIVENMWTEETGRNNRLEEVS
jgi:hypothetical protein